MEHHNAERSYQFWGRAFLLVSSILLAVVVVHAAPAVGAILVGSALAWWVWRRRS